MKPVKLEILVDDKTSKGIDSTKKSVADMTADFKRDIETQKSIVKDLERYIKDLERQINKLSDDNAKKELIPSMLEAERELVQAKNALDALDAELNNSSQGSTALRTQIRNLKEEMANMTEGTDQYREAMQRLGDLQDRMGDISQQGRVLADDEKNIRATADAIAGLSGAMSAGVGIASLFGAEQEKLNQIQTRLQAVMATTIGLQQVAQTLNKDSFFSIIILQGAKKKWAAAQALLNTQLGIGVGLSKALMASGVGLLLAGIAALVVVYQKWSTKQKEINALKKEYADLEADSAKAMANEKVKLDALVRTANNHNAALDTRRKAIEEIKKIMPEYNGFIDAEGRLIGDTDIAMKKYLETLFKVEKAKKLFERVDKNQGELDALLNSGPEYDLNMWQKLQVGFLNTFSKRAGSMLIGKMFQDVANDHKEATSKLKDSIKADNEALDELINDATIFDKLFGGDKAGTPSGTSTPENRLEGLRLSALRKIKEAEIDLMNEGEEKRKAQARFALENRIAEIASEKREYEKHLAELAKAKIPVSQEEITGMDDFFGQQAILAKKKYDSDVTAIDEEYARNYQAIQNEIKRSFATRLDAQLMGIDAHYAKMLDVVRGNEERTKEVQDAQLKARTQAILETQLQEIDLANELAIRKQEIDDRQVLLASEREERLLKVRLKGAQDYLAKLEEMEKAGIEVADDIKLTKTEIDKLSKSLANMPVNKVKEIGGHLKGWLSTLSGVGGELGETLSLLAGGVDDVMSAFDKDASKLDHVGGAISGLTKLYALAANQIEENKRKQGEWNDKMGEAAHKARLMRIEALEYNQANIFGAENPYAKAIAGANQYGEAMKSLNESLNKLAGGQIQVGTKKVVSGKNVAGGAAAGAGAGAAIGSIIPGIGTAIGAGIGALIGGIFGGTQKKVVPVFESLTKKFGSILKSGTETFELNPAILENYSKLDDATKKLVDNWEEIRNKALEAEEQMRQTFSDLAGDIGGALSDALVEAFRNGDIYSAVDKFHDSVTKTIENIIAQLVFSAHFKSMFDELEKRMFESIDGGDGDIVDDIVWFSEAYKNKLSDYTKNMEAVRDEMGKQGFDIFQPDKDAGRQAMTKGISGLTQDQGNKLEGQLTMVTMRLLTIDQNVVAMAEHLFRIFDPINRIADNTDRLEAIEGDMKVTREGIERMVREGLIMRRS